MTISASRKRGFSLLELLLVVSVGAVLILSGAAAYRLVSDVNNRNQGMRQLTTLKQMIKQAFNNQPGYPVGTLLEIMDVVKATPADMGRPTADTLRGVFGPVRADGLANGHYAVQFTLVPRAACIKLGEVFTFQNDADLTSLTVNGTAVTTFTTAGMTAACTAATENTMLWEFQ